MKQQKSDSPPLANNQLALVYKSIVEEKEPIKAEEEDQELISSLLGDRRWDAIKKIINFRIESLKGLVDPLSGKPMFSDDDSVEAIGFKFLIVSAVIGFLAEIRDLPEFYATEERKEKGE